MSLEAVLRIQAIADDAIAQIERVQSGLDGIESTASRGKGIAEMGDRLQQTGFFMRDLGQTMTAKLTNPMEGAVRKAMAFEDSMAEVAKAANLDQAGLQEMQKVILEMSREIPRSANELANMAAAGGRLGVATDDLDDFVRLTSNMAVAFDMGADQAGQAAAEIANNFKMMDTATGQVDFNRLQTFGNVVNNLADNMATTEAKIVNFTKRASGVGQTFGMAEQDVAAFAAGFTALGIAPEKASTAFNGVVQKLAMATELPEKASEGFKQLGIDAAQMQEAFASGNGTQAMMEFMGAIERGGPNAAAALNKIIGSGFSDEMLQAAGGMDQFRKAFEKSAEAVAGGGSTMADSFDIMAGTSGASLELLQNGLTEIAIAAGSVLLPALNSLVGVVTPIVQGFAAFAQAHPGITKVAVGIAAVVAAAGPLLVIAGTLVGAIGTLMSAWAGISAAFAAGGALAGVASAIAAIGAGPIIAGILAVGAAVALLVMHFDKVKAFAKQIGTLLAPAFNQAKTAVMSFVQGITSGLAPLIPMILPPLKQIGSALMTAFFTIGNAISMVVSKTAEFIGLLLPAGMSAQQFGYIVGTALTLIITGLVQVIAFVTTVVAAFISLGVQIVAALVNAAMSVINTGTSMMTGLASAVIGGGAAVIGAITSIGSQMISSIAGIAGQMFAAGANIVQRLAAGIMSGIGSVTSAMSSVASAARSMLPMSPVPSGPLTVLNNPRTNPGAKIVQMLASGMRSAVGSGIMSNALQGALPSGVGRQSSSSGSTNTNIGGITLNINVNGGGDAAGNIADALRRELPDVLEEIMGNRQRVGYSG